MTLLSPAFLWGLLAIGVPIVLHMISRFQRERIELGTVRFLAEILHEQSRKRRVRRWWLLFLRAAILALLALLFARPTWLTESSRDGDVMRVILVDRSASMLTLTGGGERLIDKAMSEARRAAAELGEDARVEVAWFDHRVEPTDLDSISAANQAKVSTASRTGQSFTGTTSYLNALRFAADRIAARPRDRADVVLITDLQRRGLDGADSVGLPDDVPVEIVDVGRPAADNIAITEVLVQRDIDEDEEGEPSLIASLTVDPVVEASDFRVVLPPDESINVAVTAFHFGDADRDDVRVKATLTPIVPEASLRHFPSRTQASTGSELTLQMEKRTDLRAGEATEWKMRFPNVRRGVWQVSVELDLLDDLEIDNRSHAVAWVDNPLSCMVIDGGTQRADESYYLRAAIEAEPTSLSFEQRLREVDNEEFGEPNSSLKSKTSRKRFQTRVVYQGDKQLPSELDAATTILVDPIRLNDSQQELLSQYVQQGGNLIVFGGERCAEWASGSELSAWLPGTVQPSRVAGVTPYRITQLGNRGGDDLTEQDASMLAPFADPQIGDLGSLTFDEVTSIRPTASSRVVAQFESDLPAIVVRDVKSDANTAGSGSVTWVAVSPTRHGGNWTSHRLFAPLMQQLVASSVGLTGEGWVRTRTSGEEISQLGTHVRDGVVWVDRLNAAESDLSRATEAEVREALGLNGIAVEEDSATLSDEAVADISASDANEIETSSLASWTSPGSHRPIWPYVVVAIMALLIIEHAVAVRTPA